MIDGRTGTLVLVAVLMTAGCLGLGSNEPSGPDAAPGNRTSADESWMTVNATASAYASVRTDNAFEPTVAAGPDGTVYVTGANSGLIHVQQGGSGEWETRPSPPPPPESRGTARGDALVSVDGMGRLWYTALLPSQVGPVDDPTSGGLQIAVSEDGGQTWSANHHIGPPEFPWNADRQWITFAPEGTAHVVWKAYQGTIQNQQDRHLAAVTLHDGGSSVGSPVNVTPMLPSATSLIGGQPSVASDGTLMVPYLEVDHSGSSEGDGALRVARSTGEGRSFQQLDVWAPPGRDPGTNFPISAVDGHDRFHLAWNGPDGHVLHTVSYDDGGTWTVPTSVSGLEDQSSQESPWIEVENGTARVAGFGTPEDGRVSLELTLFPANATPAANRSATIQVAELPASGGLGPAFTDFAHLGTLPRGDMLTVWGVPETAGGVIHLSRVTIAHR